jgi:hypothetical protein
MTTPSATKPDNPRRARFRRDTPQPMRLTDDDIAIIRHVARYRFLRSTHLLRLLPGRSEKKLIERLGALYHNAYLDRPRAQLDYYATAGSAPMVYALGTLGARVIAESGGADRTGIDWTWKNRSAGRAFIEHTLSVADCEIGISCAARDADQVAWISDAQILAQAPEATRAANNPFRLAARVTFDGTAHDLAVVPDAVFGLDFLMQRKRKYFFLEADRATMPVVRAKLDQTSVFRKFLTYVAGGGSTNAFGQHLCIGNFRALFVTTSAERTQTFLDALRQATNGDGSRQFLFTDRVALAGACDLLTMPWLSGKGEPVRLID